MSRPDALIWPEDKETWILAGVEKMFNELQDYSIIDRQKRKSRPVPKIYEEADAGDHPPPPVARSAIRPPTKHGRRRDKQPKTDVTPVPDHSAPIAHDTELGEQASSQKEELKKVASKESYDADPNTQPERPNTDESAVKSPPRKRALTPPYIPGKGLRQTWPAFGFKSVSKEGARALRERTVRIDNPKETPSKTTPTRLCGSKGLRVKADRKQGSAEKYSSTVPAERSEEGHVDDEDSKRTRKGRLPSLPKSLLTCCQTASAKPIDNGSPTSEEPSATGEASLQVAPSNDDPAVQRSRNSYLNTASSQWTR